MTPEEKQTIWSEANMVVSRVFRLMLVLIVVAGYPAFIWSLSPAQQSVSKPERNGTPLEVKDGKFFLNGKPYQIISGEMHYARIPRAYWRDRLKMAKAMGLNTISTYVFWNMHEPKPGTYDFSGNLDVAEFIRMAQQEGLNVILRPGPYACAEWELGGYPAWLLANPRMVLRSNDPIFMVPAERWMMRLGKELAPLQAGRGGPIVAIQLENEYGSFGSDKIYLQHMRQILLRAGFTNALMYTADGSVQLANGTLPGVLAVVNFGAGSAAKAFSALHKFEPGLPLMSGEYWTGWYDKWGRQHVVRDGKEIAKEYAWMLGRGYAVNIYMFHGGTNFGFMNGANIDAGNYNPVVTSYDYDAPLDESGRPTPLYFALRNVLARHSQVGGDPALPPVPAMPPPIAVPEFHLTETVSLWKALPAPTDAAQPLPMEMLGQSYGYILYRTTIQNPVHGELIFEHMQDYAQVYINGSLAGILDRRLHQDHLPLDISTQNAQLDILVENTGRVNYGRGIRTEWKGIRGSVTLAGALLSGWKIYNLPMNDPGALPFQPTGSVAAFGPAFYRGSFFLKRPGDTFLDMGRLKKGVIWVNGHNLGRFWDIGPQRTLYVPGPWLKTGENTVIVFDLAEQKDLRLRGLSAPILDAPVSTLGFVKSSK